MTPRHISKTFTNPHFVPNNYKNSIEYETELKVELFCTKIKNRILGRNKDGK
jgi:hypothetical protein